MGCLFPIKEHGFKNYNAVQNNVSSFQFSLKIGMFEVNDLSRSNGKVGEGMRRVKIRRKENVGRTTEVV